jgi:hypothetical protein
VATLRCVPAASHFARQLDRLEHAAIEQYVAIFAVEAHEAFLIGRSRWIKRSSMPCSSHHSVNALEVSSLSLSIRMAYFLFPT